MKRVQTRLSRLSRLHLLPTDTLTLTNVEEQDSPDRKSQSSQVALGAGTPLETNRQQVAKNHGAHLSDKMMK